MAGVPFLVVYRVAPLTYFLARRFAYQPYLSIVNVLAGREVVPELLQDDFTPERLSERFLALARDPARLGWYELLAAARKKGGVEWAGGAAPTAREMFPDVPKELMHDHDPAHGHAAQPPTHTHQHDDDGPSRS